MLLQPFIDAICNDPQFTGVIKKSVLDDITRQTDLTTTRIQIQLLPTVANFAQAPISNFFVGAIAQGLSGDLYFGINIEFPEVALNFTIHAEQAAVTNAFVHGEEGITSLTINAPPCGMCRQFLNEISTADQLEIILPSRPEPTLLSKYLPHLFGPKDLGVEAALLSKQNHQLQLQQPSQDKVILTALNAANSSYAPYTKAYSGVAILMKNDEIFPGAYIENAAFNPSLTPIAAALVQLNLARRSYKDIKEVVLVERPSATISQLNVTNALARSITTTANIKIVHTK